MHIVLSFVEKRNWFLEYCCILLHLKNTFDSLVEGYVIKATRSERIFGDNVSHSFEGKNAEVGRKKMSR